MQDALQNRKYAFPLEARTIVPDQKANPVTLKLNSTLGVWSSSFCYCSAGSFVQCPGTLQTTSSKCKAGTIQQGGQIISGLQIKSPGKLNRFSNMVLALAF